MPVRSDPRPHTRRVLLALSLAGIAAGGSQPRSAIVGSWRESGWELCTPVAQLTAADMDAPIDDLTFRDEGTFSVTWRGGGAHTGDVPHVFIPDYSGHYAIDAVGGRITMRIDNGLFVPRDFAGDGTYALEGNALTLTHVWFGTKQAAHRPDICELTFARK
jgi:hypothetical protein